MLSIDYLNKLIKWLTNRIVAIKVVPRIGVLEIAAVFFIFYEVNDFFCNSKRHVLRAYDNYAGGTLWALL